MAGLPEELQAILEQIKTGNVGVEFGVHDADDAVDRPVDGLVTAKDGGSHAGAGSPFSFLLELVLMVMEKDVVVRGATVRHVRVMMPTQDVRGSI